MSAAPEKLVPEPAVVVRAGDGAHRRGAWSGSVSGEALGADVIVLFVAHDEVGSGPSLHVHPYDELFIVTEGRGRFTVGDERIEAVEGDVVKGPANVPHKYENAGPGSLRTIDIHLSREWIQSDLADPDAR